MEVFVCDFEVGGGEGGAAAAAAFAYQCFNLFQWAYAYLYCGSQWSLLDLTDWTSVFMHLGSLTLEEC